MTKPIIPNDLAGCQALIVQLAQTVTEQHGKITDLIHRNEEQQLTIAELLQQAFRKRSERYLENPNQLKLDFGATPEAGDAADGLADAVAQAELVVAEHTRRQRVPAKPRREGLPAHLPRYEVEVPAPANVTHCAEHGPRQLLGYDRQETLEFERPRLRVRVTLIPKYACANQPQCGVAQPPRPPALVKGNRFDTSVAAEVITGKIGYHMPLYRQQDYFAGSGWTPTRSTLLNILTAAATLLRPLALYLKQEVLASGVLGTDETRVTLLLPPVIPAPQPDDPQSQRIHEVFSAARAEGRPSVSGRMWAYRGLLAPLNVFDFTVSRHRDGPDEFLVNSGFAGTILADCYSGYKGITLRSDARIVRAACSAHARRKIFEARESQPLLASSLLAIFQQLYAVEDRGRTLAAAQRAELRAAEARPLWEQLRAVLDGEAAARVLPKEGFAEALGYLRNQWEALTHYLTDGRLPIDNNETEQLMKQVAIGRKNWLFVGSVAAGQRTADLLTLVSSAVRNDLDVWAYLKDVLDRLLAGDADFAALRPDRWAAAHPEAIRCYRKEERAARADAKTFRRDRRQAEPPPRH